MIKPEEEDCLHGHVEDDDDGLNRHFHICLDCGEQVEMSEPDEDGNTYWEVIE